MTDHTYPGATRRFLRNDERLVLSKENEMPLVIEAKERNDVSFLQEILQQHTKQIHADLAKYGAILLRGFHVDTDAAFEKTILSIQGIKGIHEAFMSEEGRVPVGDLQYVLHTNAVYKTGGTLYLGGFHSENYYSADVPSYIFFCCHKPSERGGETGIINMQKIYPLLADGLKKQLEQQSCFVTKWLVTDVAARYQVPVDVVKQIAQKYDLPIVGKGKNTFILLYKPNVFKHPVNHRKSLQINLFEILGLNEALRRRFMQDYAGKQWFWHRFIWKMPSWLLKGIERTYIMFASFFYSPKDALKIMASKWRTARAEKALEQELPTINFRKVGSFFNQQAIEDLATHMREYYSSCLWQQGDILLVDNRQVIHAGMPGAGPRLVRAMISNSLEMKYASTAPGLINCQLRTEESIGSQLKNANQPGNLQAEQAEYDIKGRV